MQTLRAFVTLLPMIACASTPQVSAEWVQIAQRAGDQTEAQRSLQKLSLDQPFEAYRLAKRLKLSQPIDSKLVTAFKELAQADSNRAQALVTAHPQLKRAAFYRLLQLKAYPAAQRLADHDAQRALAFQASGQTDRALAALLSAANDKQPPLWAVRSWRQLQALMLPVSSAESKVAWKTLTELRAPSEALRLIAAAPQTDCLGHVVRGLALEELGRSAASAEAASQSLCLPAQIQHARILARLRPGAAKMLLEQLEPQAPLDHSLLLGMRQIYGADTPAGDRALSRLVAWHPRDHRALKDRLTQLERAQAWSLAHQLCERSLAVRYSDNLHLLSLRYLALSGARNNRHAQHRWLMYRLTWLREQRPNLQALAQVDALVAGADEEGGGLGAAATQLKADSASEQAPGAPAIADE